MKTIQISDLVSMDAPSDGWRIIEAGGEHPAEKRQENGGIIAFVQRCTPEVLARVVEAELNALQALAGGGLSAEALQGTSQALADTLHGAITNSEECRAENPDHCRVHGESDRQERALGKETRQRLTAEQVAEAREFMKKSTAKKKQIKERLPEHGGLQLDMQEKSVRGAVMTRKAVGEMLSRKAIHASLSNGCPVSAHVEAVERAPEIASKAKKVGEQSGMKEGDKTSKITHLEAEFAAADKKNYIAHYTVHHPKDEKTPPRLYFMYLRK